MVPQLVANGLVTGSIYALVALGFGLTYRTTRFFNFAHGAVFAVAAYMAYALAVTAGLPLPLAMAACVLGAAGLGVGMDLLVYRPLRRRRAGGLVLLVASLGLYTLLQNALSLAFGDDSKSFGAGQIEEGMALLGARVTPLQVGTLMATVCLLLLVSLGIARTQMGRAIRAVSDDAELALVFGADPDRVILMASAVGSALAAVAATLSALDVGLNPTMGMHVLMMGIVAVIVGGIGSLPGAALGGFLLGLARQLAAWSVSSQWQDAIVLLILLAFLLLRPQGIFGRPVRGASV